VAYHGEKRVGFADTKDAAHRLGYKENIPDAELFVCKIQPDIGEALADWP
jgi:hypothetical protein